MTWLRPFDIVTLRYTGVLTTDQMMTRLRWYRYTSIVPSEEHDEAPPSFHYGGTLQDLERAHRAELLTDAEYQDLQDAGLSVTEFQRPARRELEALDGTAAAHYPTLGWPDPHNRVVYLDDISAEEREDLLAVAEDPRMARLMSEVVEQAAYLELAHLYLGRILTRALGGGMTEHQLSLLTGLDEITVHRLVPTWFIDLGETDRSRVTASGAADVVGRSLREEWLERLVGG